MPLYKEIFLRNQFAKDHRMKVKHIQNVTWNLIGTTLIIY